MSGFCSRTRPATRGARRRTDARVLAGIGAVVAVAAAVPATATGSHHAASAHRASERHHNKHLLVRGLRGRPPRPHRDGVLRGPPRSERVPSTTNVCGSSSPGRPTAVRRRSRPVTTSMLSATGTAHRRIFTVRHDRDEMVTPAKATLFFGKVEAVNANLLDRVGASTAMTAITTTATTTTVATMAATTTGCPPPITAPVALVTVTVMDMATDAATRSRSTTQPRRSRSTATAGRSPSATRVAEPRRSNPRHDRRLDDLRVHDGAVVHARKGRAGRREHRDIPQRRQHDDDLAGGRAAGAQW